MVSCWVLLKKPLPVEAAISKNGCKPHLSVPMCHTTPVPFHTILYQTKNTQYHTILALGFTKAYIYAMPHTTIPISLYIIKGFRNYQPIVTTISHDSLAYLQLTTLILVQCTQSKHRVAEGAISHRFRLRLVVAV